MPRALAVIAICALIFAIGALFVLGWMASYPSYTYRYRMTVAVDLDGKLHSGASVIEVHVRQQPRVTPETSVLNQTVRGEAVFVDLGEKGNVVALLASGPTGEDIDFLTQVVPTHYQLNLFEFSALAQLPNLRGNWDWPGDKRPVLVRFANPNDPRTVDIVKPESLEQVFGTGARLHGITIEMTSDAATRNLEKKLPWLSDEKHLVQFWRNLREGGFRPNASIEPGILLKRDGY